MTTPQNTWSLGCFAGLRLSAERSTLVGSLVVFALAAFAGWFWLGLSAQLSAAGGLAAVALHWSSELFHHLGHAWIARRVDHPMIGVYFWFLFGRSIYPPDEPALPSGVHIRRALGGPAASFLLATLAGLLCLAAWPWEGLIDGLFVFLLLDNLLLGLGALLPLGFTDGSTLLAWWGR